jgi:hypothetical protein
MKPVQGQWGVVDGGGGGGKLSMSVDVNDLDLIGMGPPCPKCQQETDWLRCWNCSGQGYHDDLYAQDPFWYDPGDTETCDVCEGKAGWWRCWDCEEAFDGLKFPNEETETQYIQ